MGLVERSRSLEVKRLVEGWNEKSGVIFVLSGYEVIEILSDEKDSWFRSFGVARYSAYPHPGLDPGSPLVAGDSCFRRKEEYL